MERRSQTEEVQVHKIQTEVNSGYNTDAALELEDHSTEDEYYCTEEDHSTEDELMHHSTAQAELEDHIAEDLASLLQLEMHPCCQAPGSGLDQWSLTWSTWSPT